MRGGARSNKGSPGAQSVRELIPTDRNNIINALQRMDKQERFELYMEVNQNEDAENVKMFNSIFSEQYPNEFNLAKEKQLEMVINSGRLPLVKRLGDGHVVVGPPSKVDPHFLELPEGFQTHGGKTRRTRRRRGRRSLKRKHSRRR